MILSPFEWTIAKRYMMPGRGEAVIAVVAGIGVGVVMLSVAMLVIVMSVMNGFRAELFDKLVGLNGHAIVQVIPVTSMEVAEACKILENTYRAVNIALVNELKMLYDKMGIDVWEVIEAAKTKPFGFQAFYPGPGLGGHCIPIDPFYLTWVARQYGQSTRFIELAGEINTGMPHYVVTRLGDALNDRSKPIRGSRILMLGMAYKKDIDDPRESPGFELMELLLQKALQSGLETAALDSPAYQRYAAQRKREGF